MNSKSSQSSTYGRRRKTYLERRSRPLSITATELLRLVDERYPYAVEVNELHTRQLVALDMVVTYGYNERTGTIMIRRK